MRCLVLSLVFAGCAISHPDPEPEPQTCKDHCVLSGPPQSWRDCCDSTSCYVDDSGHWVVVSCDPPTDPYQRCLDSEICVALYDDQYNGTPSCVPRTV